MTTPQSSSPEITEAMVEAGAKAAAEAAEFCWDNCAQEQWRRDMRAGLKAALAVQCCSAGIATPRRLSPDEVHAIGHARYQVEHATPDNPDCCFDYELVRNLLDIIDRDVLRFTGAAQAAGEPE